MNIDSDDARDGPGSAARETKDVRTILSFSLRELRLGVEAQVVDSVIPLVELQHVPGAPAHVKGLINLRGKPVVVVDLAEFLGLPGQERYTLDTPILLCGEGGRQVGLIVEKVLDVETEVRPRLGQERLFEGNELPFCGFAGCSGGQLLLLDVRRLVKEDFLAAAPVEGVIKALGTTGG